MDVKNYCFGIGHNLSLICQLTSEDIKYHFIIIIIIEITVEMKKILIANIYAPQTCREKIDFFEEVQNVIEALDITVLMGVFTAVMKNDCDIIN